MVSHEVHVMWPVFVVEISGSVYTLQTDNDQCIEVQICRCVADIVITLALIHF